ncbi:serpin B13-like [Perognathus longimembris pacificus]|uniref:serpin B13-like n=1 Tax=Perognathus longimembris pacificus TaxID=214514 RepID=UPI002019454D|nr:serpin B13-like [Perognathus longimembris pacificus]
MASLSASITQFGLELFKELKKIHEGNIFFSPVGISTAIGMILLGTRGATSSQLEKVFDSEKDTESSMAKTEEKEPEKTEEIHHQFQKLLTEIRKLPNGYELNISNRLFGEKTFLFLQKYLDYVEKYYHASLEPVDFVNAPDECRKKINSWVASQTHEKVSDLFPEDSLSNSTKLVLINTVYFKGQWDREFKKENTKVEEFWVNKNTSKPVQMMAQRQALSFTSLEDLQAKIVGIPYKNNDLSLFVLLPNDIDGLEKIIDQLSPEKVVEWTSPGRMEERMVDLHLPRLAVADAYDLEPVLGALGLGEAFSERGDYSGMSMRSGLRAQRLLHRSELTLSEDGAQAAAGTGVDFTVSSAPGREHVHCNHPFLFFIRHQESDSVLFFGRYSSP